MNASLERLPVLVLEPHTRCNCRCVMCDIWKRGAGDELTRDEYEKFFRANPDFTWLTFSGGEPFLRKDIVELAQLVKCGRDSVKDGLQSVPLRIADTQFRRTTLPAKPPTL